MTPNHQQAAEGVSVICQQCGKPLVGRTTWAHVDGKTYRHIPKPVSSPASTSPPVDTPPDPRVEEIRRKIAEIVAFLVGNGDIAEIAARHLRELLPELDRLKKVGS